MTMKMQRPFRRKTWSISMLLDPDTLAFPKRTRVQDTRMNADPVHNSGLNKSLLLIHAQLCVADSGCLSRNPDPTFFHPGSELFLSRILKEF
jgi:hypothetical protein